jgi:tetratricopeptide (TPR) repeat protein
VAAALALGFVLWRQAAAPPPALAILPVGYAGADADGQARWAGFWQAVSLAVEGGLPPRRTPVLLGPNAVRDLGVSSEAGARRALRARWVLSGRVTERPDVPALLELRLSDRRGRGRGTNLVIAPANPAESHAEAAIAVLDLLDLPADATARQILREGGTRRPAAAQWFQSGLELARGTREADLVRAQEQLRHATQADPAYAAAWAALAAVTHRLHLDSRDTNLLALALDQARRALALQTNNLLARITEARLLAARGQPGDLAAAEAALKTVLAAQPGRNDARHALADVMRRWQPPRTAEARRLLQAAAARSPQDVPVLMTYGEFLARGGEADLRAAAEVFRRVIRLAPDNALAHSNLGGVLHLLGETAAAEAELVRALELSELPEARSNLGTLRFFAGRYAEAVEDFRRAANWRPRSAVIHGNLGDALRTAGRPPAEYLPAYAEAARLAERELASTASAPEMRSSLALYLAVLGRGDEALAQVARLEAAGGASAHDWLACAVAAELAGRRPHALALLRRALDQGLPPAEITAHPDLQRLRADPDFSALVPKL